MKRLMFFLITVFFVGISTAGVKYVAVVETEIDAQSGVSADVSRAEAREITAELRREAVRNLPQDKYNIMTSETVQSMGGAVLEECAEENCVITLGGKIGADYIVRGIIRKIQTRLSLSVEIYETENGTLVGSSEAVRSENFGELLDKAAVACANMYKKFANTQNSYVQYADTLTRDSSSQGGDAVTRNSDSVKRNPRNPRSVTHSSVTHNPDSEKTYLIDYDDDGKPIYVAKKSKQPKPERKYDYYFAPKYQFPVGTPVSWGGIDVEGGLTWGNGVFLGVGGTLGCESDGIDSRSFRIRNINDRVLAGGGLSFGHSLNLWNNLRFAYGMSAGCWFTGERHPHFDAWNILAPFVKQRFNFMEITYRALWGFRDEVKVKYGYDDARGHGFGLNNHQLMLGLYFATSKRSRENMRDNDRNRSEYTYPETNAKGQ